MPTADYPPPSKSDQEVPEGKDEYRLWRIAGAFIATFACAVLAYAAWLAMAALLK